MANESCAVFVPQMPFRRRTPGLQGGPMSVPGSATPMPPSLPPVSAPPKATVAPTALPVAPQPTQSMPMQPTTTIVPVEQQQTPAPSSLGPRTMPFRSNAIGSAPLRRLGGQRQPLVAAHGVFRPAGAADPQTQETIRQAIQQTMTTGQAIVHDVLTQGQGGTSGSQTQPQTQQPSSTDTGLQPTDQTAAGMPTWAKWALGGAAVLVVGGIVVAIVKR